MAAQPKRVAAPPCCHGLTARRAGSDSSRPGDAPCIEGNCGGASVPMTVPGGVDPFCRLSEGCSARVEHEELQAVAVGAIRSRPHQPETPPPRVE